MRAWTWLICLGLLLGTSALADGIYTYTQADGTVVYTNLPPPGVKARKVRGTFSPAPRTNLPAAANRSLAAQYDEYVVSAAKRYNIPVALVRAIMHVESNFNTHAVSNRGASGLMQLMPDTAERMYVHDIFDVRDNIDGGVRYLRVLANAFDGDMVKMVAAYNAGPDAVRKAGGNVPAIAETQDYVRKVIALYYQYKQAETSIARTP